MIQILDNDGNLFLEHKFLSNEEASSILHELILELEWSQEYIQMYGKTIRSPRLISWVGDKDAIYTYSGTVHQPREWHQRLAELRNRLMEYTNHSFNSVLCNWYKDGTDSMGWHSDNEPELGNNPYLASLSLGQTRIFKIRHKKTGATHAIELENGSLITMSGKLQQYWQHCIPKTHKQVNSRINLTFRNIMRPRNTAR